MDRMGCDKMGGMECDEWTKWECDNWAEWDERQMGGMEM